MLVHKTSLSMQMDGVARDEHISSLPLTGETIQSLTNGKPKVIRTSKAILMFQMSALFVSGILVTFMFTAVFYIVKASLKKPMVVFRHPFISRHPTRFLVADAKIGLAAT